MSAGKNTQVPDSGSLSLGVDSVFEFTIENGDDDFKHDFTTLMLGSSDIGTKTSMISYVMHGHMELGYNPTFRDVYRGIFHMNGKQYTTMIIDEAGTDQFAAIRELDIKNADVIILGFSVVSRSSFRDVQVEYIPLIKRMKDEKKVVVLAVGGKIDCAEARTVTKEEAESYFSSLDPPIPYMEISSKTGENVREAFEQAFSQLSCPNDNPDQPKEHFWKKRGRTKPK